MKIIFCSIGGYGFLNPMIGIAKELQSQGNDVAFVTNPQFRDMIERNGLKYLTRKRGSDDDSFSLRYWDRLYSILVQYKHLELAMAMFKPDMIFGQTMTFGSFLISERYQIPHVVLGQASFLLPANSKPTNDRSKLSKHREWHINVYRRFFNAPRKMSKLEEIDPSQGINPFLGDLFLLRSVQELEPESQYLPPQVKLIGSCLWEEPLMNPKLNHWLQKAISSGKPIIYACQGRTFTTPSFWPHLVQAAKDMDIMLAASTGRMDVDVELETLSDNILAQPYIPQSLVQKHASLTIGSGNTTPVLGSLSAGAPCLLLPNGAEQPDLADCCATAGVGRVLSSSGLNAKIMADEIKQVLSSSQMKENAHAMSKAFSAVNSFETAARLITQTGQRQGNLQATACESL